MIPRRTILLLTAGALFLPIVVIVLIGAGAMLGGLDDAVGRRAVERIALAVGIGWVIDLALLLIALGVKSIDDQS